MKNDTLIEKLKKWSELDFDFCDCDRDGRFAYLKTKKFESHQFINLSPEFAQHHDLEIQGAIQNSLNQKDVFWYVSRGAGKGKFNAVIDQVGSSGDLPGLAMLNAMVKYLENLTSD